MTHNYENLLAQVHYRDKDLIRKALKDVPAIYPDLRAYVESLTSRQWTRSPLLYFSGSIPVSCNGVHTADVSIWLWLPEAYPSDAPSLYVRSAGVTEVKPCKYWDTNGKVRLSHLKAWPSPCENPSHELLELIQVLQKVLGNECSRLRWHDNGSREVIYENLSNCASSPPSRSQEPRRPRQNNGANATSEEYASGPICSPPYPVPLPESSEEISTYKSHIDLQTGPCWRAADSASRGSDTASAGEARRYSAPVPIAEETNFSHQKVTKTSSLPPKLPEYDIKPYSPGMLYALNNNNFETEQGSVQYKPRRGSELDLDKITALFCQYDFKIDTVQNLTKMELMEKLLEWINNPILHEVSSCVVVLMSHGRKGELITADGQSVSLKDIMFFFNSTNCPALVGKPKMFVIQACRGTKLDMGVEIESDGGLDESDARAMQIIPSDYTDTVSAFSTTPGYTSYRSTVNGSWYIDAFVRVFDAYAGEVDVAQMLVLINDKVATEYGQSGRKQMPMPHVGLRKKWFLTGRGPS